MRKIILDLAVTLDGFIEGPNGEIDWCIMDSDMGFDSFLSSIGTIFYGRVSYELWGSYSPGPNASETEKSFWEEVHSKQKFVFSNKLRPDGKATVVSSGLAEKIADIKKQNGKDIWLYGGSNLITTFINLGLIDTYRLSVHPIVLGNGKPLFEDLNGRLNLRLAQTNQFKSGVVQLIYERQ